MIAVLSRHPKRIAWSLAALFYIDLLMSPVVAKGGQVITATTAPLPYNAWLTYIKEHYKPANVTATQQNNSAQSIQQPLIKSTTSDRYYGPFTTGPTQPEMSSFTSVGNTNMVDLFTGDFSYNIPLLDVGGYPVNLAYRGGVSMDQEASWVGLGWNVNPGTISRNLRGLPDDFNGTSDSIRKTMNIKENKTIGVTGGADVEIAGFPKGEKGKTDTVYKGISLGASVGVVHNNYRGWGIEHGINASINSGAGAAGPLSGGLSITNSSQNGLTIAPSLSVNLAIRDAEGAGYSGNLTVSAPYNNREGLKGLQLSTGVRKHVSDGKNQRSNWGTSFSSVISFASPTYTPSITIPFTSTQFSFTGKIGFEKKVYHPSFYLSGYVSKQRIAAADRVMSLPAYGYLYYQDGTLNRGALLDFNREKEVPYREKPPVPHIALPAYTYDAFSITGEGIGGMFRAYRGDIGFIYDHAMRTKDASDKVSVDVGIGDIVHAGIDLNINRAFTQNGPWLNQNTLRQVIEFKKNDAAFESVYFRNPGEKSINSRAFYEAIGGDDVVTVGLYQSGNSGSVIQTTNYLTRYRNKQRAGVSQLTALNAVKPERDKRSQVISYLNAKEADAVGLSKYIESYTYNQFGAGICGNVTIDNVEGNGTGLPAQYFATKDFTGTPYTRTDTVIDFNFGKSAPAGVTTTPAFPNNRFSIRWIGRVRAPVTGTYTFFTASDDGVRLWLNDSLVINSWRDRPEITDSVHVNLVAGEIYKIRVDYYENGNNASVRLRWRYPGQAMQVIPKAFLYAPPIDTFALFKESIKYLVKEKRVNAFRKENHISEITVLNSDGRRYIYGIPVYNLKQKEATFAVDGKGRGNPLTGLVGYTDGTDNTTGNQQGKDNYFSSEETPAYAHSFLLTGILSADYSDVTGNGISDDDIGDAVKFNYSKICGIANPFKWRAPYSDSATYNEGLKTEYRDDKGSYVYGEKELWYLHSIESKTMIATFVLESRSDLQQVSEAGSKTNNGTAKRLKEINLYSKADFAKKGTAARPIKTVHFEYSYDLCTGINGTSDGKLTLKKVWFTHDGNNKGQQNPYVFNYNSNNPSHNAKSYDRWGNYKDPLQNPGSIPGNIITNADYPYALQDSAVAAQNSAAWSLDSIFLPSGGSIKVNYESDDYAYVQNKRAMQLFKIVGLSHNTSLPSSPDRLYRTFTSGSFEDNLYVFIKVPRPVSTVQQVYQYYLANLKKLYFRMAVSMPADQFGSGFENVFCYADLAASGNYGLVNANTIWIKLDGISLKGDGSGDYSPLTKAATQYLRLNLPSKAYPGSENGENLDFREAVEMLASLADNIQNAFKSFDRIARERNWCQKIDTSRSFVRLNNPYYKKLGGGQRVKRITIYDNWDKMTNQRAAIYGQEYSYTTVKEINGVKTTISSGVASYEPMLGGEENPFREPIEYVEKASVLGPVTLGYTEEPLGETFFPSPGVGYSKVRVRTINYKNKRSANGYDETCFFTAYDFPTYTDRSLLDNDTKKRYKPALSNLLRVNAKHYIALSQGFKIELNDMHGKLRSQASYAETDSVNPVSYVENIYKVENPDLEFKRLSNTVMAIHPDGTIDSVALIGKDVELMVDMREQLSITNGDNINLNADVFSIPAVPPFFVVPSFYYMGQREENLYRSVATVKIIQRYGILDSIIQIDKGSKTSTKDLLYDSETGGVLLTRTQNEFNDYVYNFTYPSHWAYDGMGMAYRNIDVRLDSVSIRDGKILQGLPAGTNERDFFAAGDELLIANRQQTGMGSVPCQEDYATFPNKIKIWAIDVNATSGDTSNILFIDKNGQPYTGNDIDLRIIRSGRKNVFNAVGSIVSLKNPVIKNGSNAYILRIDDTTQVLNAQAMTINDKWKTSVECNSCALDSSNCQLDIIPANFQAGIFPICLGSSTHSSYSQLGAVIYSSLNDPTGSAITNLPSNFWRSQSSPALGPLNRTSIWLCDSCSGGLCTPVNTWIRFSHFIDVPFTGSYYVGMAADNQVRVFIDGVLRKELLQIPGQEGSDAFPFLYWHIFPINLQAGRRLLTIEARNSGGVAGFGLEVYNNTEQELRAATAYTDLDTVYSTRNYDGDTIPAGHSCPMNYTLDSTGGNFVCIGESNTQRNVNNPFTSGLIGNWRNEASYSYYAARSETDPSQPTNIRSYGTFAHFSPFWRFENNRLVADPDTSRWVWNTKATLFNVKGFELENKDPLGRYNSGQYGYSNTMPLSVTQNSRYREAAFEGFEDYNYGSSLCDSACGVPRHIDFSAYKNNIDSTQKHSGKYSLRVEETDTVALAFAVTDFYDDTTAINISFTPSTNNCIVNGQGASEIQTDTAAKIPVFSPLSGKRMVVGAWVKEDVDCKCSAYTRNRIALTFNGTDTTTILFVPSGAIIEGWQRYESVFDVPDSTESMVINLQATTDTVTVFFDDLRIQPFNSNMKSFVFHPVNLRLMAELDENNYATFYEYDDDGTLIRVKKETQRGIKTIKETRSALVKEQ